MLVVLDTNAFHGDMRADRGRLRSILDGAVAQGAIELFVPEVVLAELDKQFAQRSKRVVRDVNKALGDHARELHELGLDGPPRMTRDDDDIATYRDALEARLAYVGAQTLPLPADLRPAVAWAVQRRKPFKQSGDGFPDAVIWLSVLELAGAREDDIVLVTSNVRDFGTSSEPPALAEELADDLADRGRPRTQVRLVDGVDAFAREVARRVEEQRAQSLEQAEALAAAGSFGDAIERTLLYSRLDQGPLELGVELDEDPQVVGWDLESLTIEEASSLTDDHLLIEATAEGSVLLDLLIYKADYYLVSDDDASNAFSVTDANFNKHYAEAESEVGVRLTLSITTDRAGADVEVEVTDVELSSEEEVARALVGRGLEELLDALRPELVGHALDEYVPDVRLESHLDEVTIASVARKGSARLVELLESDGERHSCLLEARLEGDVEWAANAPTPFDAERFGSHALNEESGAPILVGSDGAAPLVAELTASWDAEHGWHAVEVQLVRLAEAEQRRRAERGTAADELFFDAIEEPDEPLA